jgi:hypothetical protein
MSESGGDRLVINVRWDEFGRSYGGDAVPRAFLELVPQGNGTVTAKPTKESVVDRLLAVAPGRPRRALLEGHLQETLAGVLKAALAQIDLTKPMGLMGVDSLMALQFVRRLAATTAVHLPATAVFNYPTLRLLAAELARRMGVPLDAGDPAENFVPSGSQDSEALPRGIANLTEEEAIQALSQGGDTRL